MSGIDNHSFQGKTGGACNAILNGIGRQCGRDQRNSVHDRVVNLDAGVPDVQPGFSPRTGAEQFQFSQEPADLMAALGEAVGAASVAWENFHKPGETVNTGVFDDGFASSIVRQVHAYVEANYVPRLPVEGKLVPGSLQFSTAEDDSQLAFGPPNQDHLPDLPAWASKETGQ